ncbi:hypothetical protein EUX98_g4885 [Antrodiella citrinella]|uniref:Uncharacterized protein n=1 Tax=Antrodiella citrinella TaxID=2447956 RepID=A0A4S4MT33_9APHY|nr:hypothetical protein EUX98_g4885 [Antrodiella citrinella]
MFSKAAFVFAVVVLSALNANAIPAPHKADGCDVTTTANSHHIATTSLPPPTSTGSAKNGTLVSTGNNSGNSGAAGNNNSTASASASSTAAVASSTSSASSSSDAQTSLTLDPSVIAKGFANNGQDVPAAGQVASLTSTNNFINFCLTVPNLPLTNGQQITTGSCNTAPMGIIPSSSNMPSSKFTFPQNFGTVKANTAFTISMAIAGMETGFFVNADENYFAAPQQTNAQGQVQGHSHVVVEQIDSLTQTTVTNPQKFTFFKGLNSAAVGGLLTADVTSGLPAGVYRLASINTAANHQPVLGPIAQHGSFDDQIYFTVTDDGAASGNSTSSASAVASSAAATSAAASSAAATSAAASAANNASATAKATTTPNPNKGGSKGGNNGSKGGFGGFGGRNTRRWL